MRKHLRGTQVAAIIVAGVYLLLGLLMVYVRADRTGRFVPEILLICAGLGAISFLLLWSVRKCARCGRIFFRLLDGGPPDVCTRYCPSRLRWLAAFVAVLFLAGFAVAVGRNVWHVAIQLGVPEVLCYALGVVAGLGVLVGLACLSGNGRRALAALGRSLWRIPSSTDFAAARRAGGAEGRLTRFGPMTLWSNASDGAAESLRETAEDTLARFPEITGLPAGFVRPLRVILFEREAAMVRYCRGTPNDGNRVLGAYSGIGRKRAVLSYEAAERPPSTFAGVVAHEVTHHLVHTHLKRMPRPWLSEGLAELLPRDSGARQTAPGGGQRHWLAAHARGSLPDPHVLFRLSYGELGKQIQAWRHLPNARFCAAVYQESALLLWHLHEQHGEALKRFLARCVGEREPERHFADCFAVEPEAALERLRQRLLAATLPPYEVPPEPLRQRMEAEIVPVVRDREGEADDRRLAIRAIGTAGYPCWSDVLIDILQHEPDPWPAEAEWALERIAGEVRSPDLDAWRAWQAGLPQHVLAT